MKLRSAIGFVALLLLAITPWAQAQDKGPAITQPSVEDTAHTASDMTALYYNDDNLTDCGTLGKVTLPAFFCTGIIIRAATPGADFNSWNVSPEDVATGGVSFSYIRKDSKFQSMPLGRTSGFTLYPTIGQYKYQGPARKTQLNVICAFPIDGWTDYRGAPIGCGRPTTSESDGGAAGDLCQKQKITAAAQWYKHFQSSTYQNPKLYQCGFDVATSAHYDIADAFNQMIAAMGLLGSVAFADHNELRVEQWKGTPADALPIQSFFYVGNPQTAGWTNARKDQTDYYNATGEFVPVIQITLPAGQNGQFKFNYHATDQVVSSQ